jgi:hypothetical protein
MERLIKSTLSTEQCQAGARNAQMHTRNKHARFHTNVFYEFSKVHDKDQVSMSTVKILANYLPSSPRVRVI